MKRLPLLALALLLSSCTYLQNRADDASDMITASVEEGGLNASVQLAHLDMGFGTSTQGVGYNLLGRNFGQYYLAESMFLGTKGSQLGTDTEESENTVFPFFYRWEVHENEFLPTELEKETPWTHYCQIEIHACLQLGARVGFNIGEILDFVLGFTTLDIAGDDLKAKASFD